MVEAKLDASQEQAMASQVLGKIAVMSSLAVGGVADDWMGEVLQVAAELMAASSNRFQFEQGVAATRIAVDLDREFDGVEPAVMGDGGLGLPAAVHTTIFIIVPLSGKGVIDRAAFRRVATDDSPVTFVDRTRFELLAKLAGDLGVQSEQQHAGGAAVQSVRRPDALADLIAQDLNGEACFVAVDFGAMDEQVGRLIDDDDVVVAIKHAEWRLLGHFSITAAVHSVFRQKTGPWRRRGCPCR